MSYSITCYTTYNMYLVFSYMVCYYILYILSTYYVLSIVLGSKLDQRIKWTEILILLTF